VTQLTSFTEDLLTHSLAELTGPQAVMSLFSTQWMLNDVRVGTRQTFGGE